MATQFPRVSPEVSQDDKDDMAIGTDGTLYFPGLLIGDGNYYFMPASNSSFIPRCSMDCQTTVNLCTDYVLVSWMGIYPM